MIYGTPDPCVKSSYQILPGFREKDYIGVGDSGLMLHHYAIVNWILTSLILKYFLSLNISLSLGYFNNFQRAAMVGRYTEHPLKTC